MFQLWTTVFYIVQNYTLYKQTLELCKETSVKVSLFFQDNLNRLRESDFRGTETRI